MTELSLETRVATARYLLRSYDPAEYESLPAEQRAQLQEAIEFLDGLQEWFARGVATDA